MAEAAIKIFAMPTGYWKDGWNIFDQIVIAASLVDVGVSQIRGLSVIRTFRLVRW
jgi:voltage-gated sodium channel type V alpha